MAGNSKRKPGPGRPFKAGTSGNLSGRPKLPTKIKEMLVDNAEGVLKALIRTAKNPNHRDHVLAAKIVLERVLGKNPIPVLTLNEQKAIELSTEAVIAAGIAAVSTEIGRLASLASNGVPLQPGEASSLPGLITAFAELNDRGEKIARSLTDEQLEQKRLEHQTKDRE